jgi:hypothetical protein
MGVGRKQDASAKLRRLLFVFLLLVVVVGKITVFADFGLLLIFLVFIVVHIFRDDVEVHGMNLGDFEFGFAFGATEDLALFDFVLVDINLRGAFRAADHGTILRKRAKGRRC